MLTLFQEDIIPPSYWRRIGTIELRSVRDVKEGKKETTTAKEEEEERRGREEGTNRKVVTRELVERDLKSSTSGGDPPRTVPFQIRSLPAERKRTNEVSERKANKARRVSSRSLSFSFSFPRRVRLTSEDPQPPSKGRLQGRTNVRPC